MQNKITTNAKSFFNNKIKPKIESFFNNSISTFKLNLSFFSVGIFFSFISYPNPDSSRAYIGSVFLGLWFLSAPFLDAQKREQIMIELFKLFISLVFSSLLFIYFVKTFNKDSYVIIIDIILSFIFLAISYYWIGCLLSIAKVFKIIISKVYETIFHTTDNDSPMKIFFKNISAFLLTISGFLATLIAVITSIKTIIDTIK